MHHRLQQLNKSLAERVEIQAKERDRILATFPGPSHRHRCTGNSVEHQPSLDGDARLDAG